MKLVIYVAVCLLAMAIAVFAAQESTVPLSELDKYKLQAAEATANFETLRMDTVVRNFIETNPQVKAYNESANKAIADRDALRAKLFEDAMLSPADYELRAVDGAFVKIDKAAVQ